MFKTAVKHVAGLVNKGKKLFNKAKAWGKRKFDSAKRWVSKKWKSARSGPAAVSGFKSGLHKIRRGFGRLLKNAEARGRRMIRDAREQRRTRP